MAELEQRISRILHYLFQTGIAIKAVHVVLGLGTAVLIYVLSGTTLTEIATSVASARLSEDPNEYVLALITGSGVNPSSNGHDFAIFYLLTCALVNVMLIAGALRQTPRSYIAAAYVLGAFTAYQAYLLIFTWSWLLFAFVIYDLILTILFYREYKVLKAAIPLAATESAQQD